MNWKSIKSWKFRRIVQSENQTVVELNSVRFENWRMEGIIIVYHTPIFTLS